MAGLIADLAAGSVSALVTLSYSVSYAALVFSGPALEPILPAGLHVALIAAALVAFVVALRSSVPYAIGGPDSNATAVLAIMAANLAALLAARGFGRQQVAEAVLLMLAASAVLTGLLVLLLGVLRWGRLVRLLPYPVAGGFLAGSGFLVLSGAFKVLTDQPLTWGGLFALPAVPGLAWVTALMVAATLLIVPRFSRHFLLVPAVIGAGFLGFYLGLALHGGSVTAARSQGLLMTPIEEGTRVWSWRFASEAPWDTLATEWTSLLAMIVVVIVTILLNAAGLELATHRELDLDRELRVSGLANLASGLAGGMVGYLSVSRSLLNYHAGAVSRTAGIWTAGLCAAVSLFFTPIVFYAPRPVLAGLLIYLGLALLREWLWDAFFKLPLREYVVIVAILVLVALQGIIMGVAFGLLVASGFFAYSYSRANYIRHSLSVSTNRSNKERSLEESVALRERGGIARALCLQGYLFFAFASSLVETCRELITREGVRYLLLDFRMVQGLDASAALGFAKLHQLCTRHEVTLVLSGLRPELQAVLKQMRFLPHPEIHLVADLDYGLEWMEDRVLAAAPRSPGVMSGNVVGWAQEVDLRHMLATQFSPDALEILLGLCETMELEPGETLIRRGDPGDALYFVERGVVSVQMPLSAEQHKRVRALAPGTIVGEMALYSGQPRSADVVAATACRVRRLTAERFARLQHDHPMVANQFHCFVVTLLSERLSAVNDEIRSLL
jgi:SulP family sulfate permease